ncbi:MAG TPA: hypothetical protein VH120_05680 [Gemmataceae bacterium]|jgi:hypothetical protein|nr:hypothetical protein [Gemmataceae bacterium]
MVSAETHKLIERAERLYEERLKAKLEATHLHEFVAIEPESGDYFLGPTLSEASAACRAVYPDRRAHLMRVGHKAAVHMGGML